MEIIVKNIDVSGSSLHKGPFCMVNNYEGYYASEVENRVDPSKKYSQIVKLDFRTSKTTTIDCTQFRNSESILTS